MFKSLQQEEYKNKEEFTAGSSYMTFLPGFEQDHTSPGGKIWQPKMDFRDL